MFFAQGQEVTDKWIIAILLEANDLLVVNSQLIADRDGTSGRDSSKQWKSFSSEYVYRLACQYVSTLLLSQYASHYVRMSVCQQVGMMLLC